MSNRQQIISTEHLTADALKAPEHAIGWRITMTEACPDEDRGSIGCHYVMESMRRAGWSVTYYCAADRERPACDVELISVHHFSDYETLRDLPRTGRIRIVGGHAMAVNPRPIIHMADVVCVGEGESWILEALRRLADDFRPEALRDLPGTIVSNDWEPGKSAMPTPRMEYPVPKNPAYLNRKAAGHAATWYLEMSRGCPFSCHYCELGHTSRYRIQDTQWLLQQIDAIDTSMSNRVSLFAPDEASHPGYGQVLQRIHERGIVTSFGSMRMEQIIRRNLDLKANMLVRVGMDGLTEQTRYKVGRKQSDDYFVEYFRWMSERGHTNFKIFMIVGYPWETPADLDQWIALMRRIMNIPRKTNAHLRIKITPLIPQPKTPLEFAEAKYDFAMITRMQQWISAQKLRQWVSKQKTNRATGWFLEQDGCVMSYKNWLWQCRLARGDETLFRSAAP